MKHIDLLLPFGLPQTELAPDLLKAMKAPALAMLLARAKSLSMHVSDGFSRLLPHEAWFARQFGLAGDAAANTSPPLAVAAMPAFGSKPDAGVWFMLQPVHIHIARDHLVLTDLRRLAISEQESQALFSAAKPLFEEVGMTLVFGDAATWFVRADAWSALQTSTPDAACGHNIDIWNPKGAGDRAWRKLQNEVQMHWHTHAVNEERERRGLKPVNSLWLWGGAPAEQFVKPPAYTHACNLPGWMAALSRLAAHSVQGADANQLAAASPGHGLVAFDTLTEAALAGDWSEWLLRFHALENEWLAPLLTALQSGKVDRIGLILTDNTRLAEFAVTRHSLRKFWTQPSLTRLAS